VGEQAGFLGLNVLVGALTGVIGSLFFLSFGAVLHYPQVLRSFLPGPLAIAAAAFLAAAMTCASLWLVRRYAPEASGSGVQEIEGALAGARPMRGLRVLPVKFVGGLLSIGAGLVLGREGPTIHMGGSIGGAFTQFFHKRGTEFNGLIAAGAGAGLATAFNAPLAAIIFVIEETRKQFDHTPLTYMGVAIAAGAATIVTELIGGVAPDLAFVVDRMPLWTMSLFLLLGIVLAFAGVLLNWAILRGLGLAGKLAKRVPYLFPALFGGLVGILVMTWPNSVMGNEPIIPGFLAGNGMGLLALLGLLVVRFFMTVGSYSTGVPGGIFAPILTLATILGLTFTGLLDLFVSLPGHAGAAFAIAAMGGLFTSVVRAPMVGVVLTVELTGSYELILPLIFTCLAAHIVADWIGGEPIYEQLLDRTLRLAKEDEAAKAANATS